MFAFGDACPGNPWDREADDDDSGPADADDDVAAWDASPPDVADGATLSATVSCAAFLGPTDKAWVKAGPLWQEQPGSPAEMLPELAPCVVDGPRELTWTELPRIRFLAGGWEHVLDPSSTPDRWVGGAEPLEPSADCLDAIDDLGWTLPLTMSFDVTGLTGP